MKKLNPITAQDLELMIKHWLNTPVCGYLGSDYGQDLKSLLHRPHLDKAVDEFLDKLRQDIVLLYALPPASVNVYSVPTYPDGLNIYIDVAGISINLSELM